MRLVNSVFSAAVVVSGMALLSVPAFAQRGGGGAPVPENCPAQPEWQTKKLAEFQAELDKANPPAPAAARGGGGAAAAGGRGAGGGGGRGAGGGGRGRGGAPAELPPVPRIPNEPAYGVQAGKPDFGGLAKGVWNVPYIINMATQGRAENRLPGRRSLQAGGPRPVDGSRVEEQRGRRPREFLSASRRASHDVHPVSRADLSDARPHRDGFRRWGARLAVDLDGWQAASQG